MKKCVFDLNIFNKKHNYTLFKNYRVLINRLNFNFKIYPVNKYIIYM